jgi:hypothetical protein
MQSINIAYRDDIDVIQFQQIIEEVEATRAGSNDANANAIARLGPLRLAVSDTLGVPRGRQRQGSHYVEAAAIQSSMITGHV